MIEGMTNTVLRAVKFLDIKPAAGVHAVGDCTHVQQPPAALILTKSPSKNKFGSGKIA